MDIKATLLLILALIAFAANSVLCRLALGSGQIDPVSFTVIRLAAGAIVLGLILLSTQSTSMIRSKSRGSWLGTVSLFTYAVAFSFAYMTLDAGTGALILFGAVQITMLAVSIFRGHKVSSYEFVGVFLAFAGMAYLMLPNLSTPSIGGFVLMLLAGIAWGAYSLIGKGSSAPLNDTAFNFIRTLPFVFILMVMFISSLQIEMKGVLLAILSGGIASGIGYAIWYRVLPMISHSVAAVSQLSVPIIAAIGGLIWIAEPFTQRLLISSVMVIGGIAIVIYAKNTRA